MSIHVSRRLGAIAGASALAAVALLGAAAPAYASQPADDDGEHKVTFCHATHSEKNPYVVIRTDKIAPVKAHDKHQDDEDVIPGFFYKYKGVEYWFDESAGDGSIVDEACGAPPVG